MCKSFAPSSMLVWTPNMSLSAPTISVTLTKPHWARGKSSPYIFLKSGKKYKKFLVFDKQESYLYLVLTDARNKLINYKKVTWGWTDFWETIKRYGDRVSNIWTTTDNVISKNTFIIHDISQYIGLLTNYQQNNSDASKISLVMHKIHYIKIKCINWNNTLITSIQVKLWRF